MKLEVMQECNRCGKHFKVVYYSNGAYDYCDSNVCDCVGSEFSPVNGPSIGEWMDWLEANGWDDRMEG